MHMAILRTHPPMRSGMPLGGIGAGSVELRPDGEFHEWQIANPQQFSVHCGDIPHPDKGEGLAGSLSFYLLARVDGRPVLRRLGMGFGPWGGPPGEAYRQRMYSFHKPVEEIEYEATFPAASLRYRDAALPLDIRLRAVSPFVPYHSRVAGTPGFYLTFSLRNLSPAPVEIALAAKLVNILPPSGRENRIVTDGNRATLCLRAARPEDGSVALSMAGGDITSIPGDYPGFMGEYVSHGELGVVEESFLFTLRRRGRLPFSGDAACAAPQWPEAGEADALSDEAVNALLRRACGRAFAESLLDRDAEAVPGLEATPEGRKRLLKHILRNARDLSQKSPWGDGALCSGFTLAPGETREVRLVLAWRFPRLVSGGGADVGHVYENWFRDAKAAAAFLSDRREDILPAAALLARNLYDTSFPECFSDAVSQQLSNLVKSAWWTRDGGFGVWEGLGSCGFQTMDITYHGSFGLAALFPDLQQKQMEMSARFQRPDGRVPHFFTPDFSRVDDGFDRVDMNPQFVLLVCRDYFATGDKAYLSRLWPHVVRAMDSIAALDTDGDCLPDRDTGRNTYDAWHFSGASTYISVLWLAALKAASALAEDVGDENRRARWRAMLETGRRAVEEKLFNGEYYDLWRDGGSLDGCCMTDQLDGEYFSRLIGLGGLLDPDRVNAALSAIYRLNYSPENGLVNASYPEGKRPTLYTCRNCQATANWSGIEYMMAAFYLLAGRYSEGLSIVENVQERHARLGEMFNHEECGDHYYRPLSSWCLLQALSGVSVNAAQRALRLEKSPLPPGGHAPWFSSYGFGQVRRLESGWRIECLSGRLEADSLRVSGAARQTRLRLSPGQSAVIDD